MSTIYEYMLLSHNSVWLCITSIKMAYNAYEKLLHLCSLLISFSYIFYDVLEARDLIRYCKNHMFFWIFASSVEFLCKQLVLQLFSPKHWLYSWNPQQEFQLLVFVYTLVVLTSPHICVMSRCKEPSPINFFGWLWITWFWSIAIISSPYWLPW